MGGKEWKPSAEQRKWILRGEICSLFHDLRKLDARFIEYRQTWYDDPKGYENDPHEKAFAELPETLLDTAAGAVVQRLQETSDLACPGKEEALQVSPDTTIRDHVRGEPGVYIAALRAGDALDSAQDRNNPLWSAEQNDRTRTVEENRRREGYYRSNVFGYETWVTKAALDDDRRQLYEALAKNGLLDSCWPGLPADWETRERLIETLKTFYERGCSDTTRPGNDTSLWEHVYAVTSLTKALQAHYVAHGNRSVLGRGVFTCKGDDLPFRLWAMGWDAVRFMSRSQRIPDFGARRDLMARLRSECRKLIEYGEALGNAVYEDDGSLVFLVPNGAALDKMREDIETQCIEQSGGEIFPHFCLSDPTRDTTLTAEVLNGLHAETTCAPYRLGGKAAQAIEKELAVEWQQGRDVCSICGLRPAKNEVEVGRICKTCQDRRDEYRRKDTAPDATKLAAEIADGHGRVALIVARFDLKDWLNGKMVRSLFVSEARGLSREVEQLGMAREFARGECRVAADRHPDIAHNFNRIRQEVLACFELQEKGPKSSSLENLVLARNSYFLYGRRTAAREISRGPNEAGKNEWEWDADARPSGFKTREDELVNRLNAKTPTPSSLLDVWITTQEFLGSLRAKVLTEEVIPSQKRALFKYEAKFELSKTLALYRGSVAGFGPVEFYPWDSKIAFIGRRGESAGQLAGKTITNIWIDDRPLRGKTVEIGSLEPAMEEYRPIREIMATPQIYLALVPAEHAVAATIAIEKAFQERFGKVRTRLPFSVGNLFFDDHYPMFLALDAARRMLRRFDGLLPDAVGQLGHEVPTALGDGTTDWYHPYVYVQGLEESSANLYRSYMPAPRSDDEPGGVVVHVNDLRGGEKIEREPSIYDFHYLTQSAARFDLQAEGRREIRLEQLRADMDATWARLREMGMEDSELRALLARLDEKRRAWGVVLPLKPPLIAGTAEAEWAALAEIEIRRRFAAQQEFFRRQFYSGLIFETARLYLQALRQRLGGGGDEEAEAAEAAEGAKA